MVRDEDVDGDGVVGGDGFVGGGVDGEVREAGEVFGVEGVHCGGLVLCVVLVEGVR